MRDVERLVKGAALATPLTTTEPPPKHTDCAACIGGKASRKPHSGGRSRAAAPLDLIHLDIIGPFETTSYDRKRYALTIVDDHSRVTSSEPLWQRSDAADAFKRWQAMVERSTGRKIRAVMADNAPEFTQGQLKAYLDEHGIALLTSVPYTLMRHKKPQYHPLDSKTHSAGTLAGHSTRRSPSACISSCSLTRPTVLVNAEPPSEVSHGYTLHGS